MLQCYNCNVPGLLWGGEGAVCQVSALQDSGLVGLNTKVEGPRYLTTLRVQKPGFQNSKLQGWGSQDLCLGAAKVTGKQLQEPVLSCFV